MRMGEVLCRGDGVLSRGGIERGYLHSESCQKCIKYKIFLVKIFQGSVNVMSGTGNTKTFTMGSSSQCENTRRERGRV